MKRYKIKHKPTDLYYEVGHKLSEEGTIYDKKPNFEDTIVFFVDEEMVSVSEFVIEEKDIYLVGDKLSFMGEKQRYTIQACDDRFLICTKPFNLKRTVLYTIVDLQENIRGTEDLVFCMGYETQEECEDALIRLQSGESCISRRNRVQLSFINN